MSDAEDLEKDLASAAASKITEGFNQLSAGLQSLQQQAELAEQEEQKAMKRQASLHQIRPKICPQMHPHLLLAGLRKYCRLEYCAFGLQCTAVLGSSVSMEPFNCAPR